MTVSDNSKENEWIPECCSGLFRQSFPRAHHGPPPVVPVRHQNVSGHFDLIYYLITTLKEEAGGWVPVREDSQEPKASTWDIKRMRAGLLNYSTSYSMEVSLCPSFYFYDPTSFPGINGFMLSISMVSRGEDTRLQSQEMKLVIICAPIGLGLMTSALLHIFGLGFGSSSSGSTPSASLISATTCGLSSPDGVVLRNR